MDASAEERYTSQLDAMLADIARLTRETAAETGRSELNTRVLDAVARVPRHLLVPPDQRAHAYENRPLAIGSGQTISQPFMVAVMTDLLDVKRADKVLEIGTGSGYQTAVLAELGARVYTIEIAEELGREAQKRLRELGYQNVVSRIGDGREGWAEHAPFDHVLVAAASSDTPGALLEQLRTGGNLVMPIGADSTCQTLYLIRKDPGGEFSKRAMFAVRFVPLTGGR